MGDEVPLRTRPALTIGIPRSTSAPKISSPLSNVMSIDDPVELPPPAYSPRSRSRPLLIDFVRNKRPREPLQPLGSNLSPLKEEDDKQDKRNKTGPSMRWKWLSRTKSAPGPPTNFMSLRSHPPDISLPPSPSKVLEAKLSRVSVPASAHVRIPAEHKTIITRPSLAETMMSQYDSSSSSEEDLPITRPSPCAQRHDPTAKNSILARSRSLGSLNPRSKSPPPALLPMSRCHSTPQVLLAGTKSLARAKSQSSLSGGPAERLPSSRKVVVKVQSGGRAIYHVYY